MVLRPILQDCLSFGSLMRARVRLSLSGCGLECSNIGVTNLLRQRQGASFIAENGYSDGFQID
jgi:hypothetical protein